MKLNLTQILKLRNGEIIKDRSGETLTLGLALSSIIDSAEIGGKFKANILAQKFYSDKTIDLDGADLRLVEQGVEASKQFVTRFQDGHQDHSLNTIICGQILEILDEKPSEKKEE